MAQTHGERDNARLVVRWSILATLLLGLGCKEASQAPARDAPGADATARPAAPPRDAGVPWRFVLDERKESYETFVTMHPKGAEHPELDWRPTSKSLRVRFERGVEWGAQADVAKAMIAELDARRAPKWDETKLFAHVDLFSYPELGARLAKHAQSDPAWSRLRGSVRKPGGTKKLHDYIRETLLEEDLHPELDRVFAAIARRPRLESVEKCWSERPSAKTDAGKQMRALGFTGRARLPGGCLMMWFELVSTR